MSTFRPTSAPGYTGYNKESERGQRLGIRAGNGQQHHRASISLWRSKPDDTGGDDYRWNIANCNTIDLSSGATR